MPRKIVPDLVNQQEVWSLKPQATAREAARFMTQRKIGAVMVVADGKLVGILSERDLMTKVMSQDRDPDQTLLNDIMTRAPITIAPADDPRKALELMREHNIRHLPVTSDGRPVAMVSVRDLYDAVKAELEADLAERDAYIYGSGYGVGPS
jgi:CBS domain-containing protein